MPGFAGKWSRPSGGGPSLGRYLDTPAILLRRGVGRQGAKEKSSAHVRGRPTSPSNDPWIRKPQGSCGDLWRAPGAARIGETKEKGLKLRRQGTTDQS
ncbi:hypothetical protein NDU88_002341 [Pleurodeles waltl]|uniref:Uncharacterized protein n=1 Tax=Pleurodeles waltl TaxID=8319 RepID=A0AAV7WNB9_PLEWA|nr:hypothetical protein NDU88_002341 [Pleurodeles waltl]